MIKIYNEIRIDINTGEVLYEDSFMYDGPLVLCDDGDNNDSTGPNSTGGGFDGSFGGFGGGDGGYGQGPGTAGQGNYGGGFGIGDTGIGWGGEWGGGNYTSPTSKSYGSGSFFSNLFSTKTALAAVKGFGVAGLKGLAVTALATTLDSTYGITDQVKDSVSKAVNGFSLSNEDTQNISSLRGVEGGKHAATIDGIMDQNYGGSGDNNEILNSYYNYSNTTGSTAAGGQAMAQTSAQTSAGGNVAADWQQRAVDYLIERGAIPDKFRDEALKRLGGLAGLEGGIGSQEDLIGRAKESPLYAEIMGGQKAGEESILRNTSVTGGLRSGNVNANMYDFNTNLQNKALLDSYNQELMGLQGLANLSGETTAIAQGMSNVGTTMQAGINRDQEIGFERDYAYQARKDQQSRDEKNNWLGIAALGVELFSDRRLKKNIKKLGKIGGFLWYSWDWNSTAEKLGLKGSSQGVIADEILKTNPKAVSMKNHFMTVNYGELGILGVQNA